MRLVVGAALALVAWTAAAPPTARAGEADVVDARAECDAERVCRFVVAVRHADEGWEHYADRWEVVAEDGRIVATRILRHPHPGEQPFSRDLAGVRVPPEVERVQIRAHDSVHGLGGAEFDLELMPRP